MGLSSSELKNSLISKIGESLYSWSDYAAEYY